MNNNIDISKRTQGTWKLNLHEFGDFTADIEGNYGKNKNGIESIRTIALITNYAEKEESEANAAFIVKACNNYDKLIEALREVVLQVNSSPAALYYHSSIIAAEKLLQSLEQDT